MYGMADTKSDAIMTALTAYSKLLSFQATKANYDAIFNGARLFKSYLQTAMYSGAEITNIIPEQEMTFWYKFSDFIDMPPAQTAGGKSLRIKNVGQTFADLQAVHKALMAQVGVATTTSQSPLPATPAQGTASSSPAAGSGSITKYWPYVAAAAAVWYFFLRPQ